MLKIKYIICILALAACCSVYAGQGFSKAKKKLYTKVFNNSGRTFYCDCDWSKKKVALNSCGLAGYFPKKQRKRAKRTEAEHIIPASWLQKKNKKPRQCVADAKAVGEAPRNYCSKHDREFRQAHNDLANLYPAVGQVNADRSNKPFLDSVKFVENEYGKQCNAVEGKRGFVPPDHRKGDIARIAFYMSGRYGVVYSKRQQKLFEKWDVEDPVTDDEIAHHKRVIKIQGFGLELTK